MAKQMNLIPLEVKQKRRNKQYKQIGALSAIIPVAICAQAYFSIYAMENKVEELKLSIDRATSLEKQIDNEQKTMEKNRSIIINLTSGGLPLNKFLLFTGVHLPEDIRLYSVTSQSIIDDQTNKGKEGANGQEVVNSNTENKSTEEGAAEGEEAKDTNSVVVEQKTNTLVIKGASLNVDSVGRFMNELESKNEYIENVDIVDVQNYYNGVFNYKLFELIVQLKN